MLFLGDNEYTRQSFDNCGIWNVMLYLYFVVGTIMRQIFLPRADVLPSLSSSSSEDFIIDYFMQNCSFSTVSCPSDHPKRCTLFAPTSRPVHSDTNSASPGSILAAQQLRATTKSLTFPPLSIARYSFIQPSQLGRQSRERKFPPNLRNGSKEDSNPGSFDCESGILPLSYRPPCLCSCAPRQGRPF